MKGRLKAIAAGLAAGALAGTVILGIGGRLAMRLIAMVGGFPGSQSWGGSLEVVAFGLILGVVWGFFFGLVHRYAFTGKLLTGLLFGLLLYGLVVAIPMDPKAAIAGFPDHLLTITLIFGVLFVMYGLTLVSLFHRFLKRFSRR